MSLVAVLQGAEVLLHVLHLAVPTPAGEGGQWREAELTDWASAELARSVFRVLADDSEDRHFLDAAVAPLVASKALEFWRLFKVESEDVRPAVHGALAGALGAALAALSVSYTHLTLPTIYSV